MRIAVAYTAWLASLAVFFVLRDSGLPSIVASLVVLVSAMRWAERGPEE